MFDNLVALFLDGVLVAYDQYIEVRNSETAGRSKRVRTGVNAATQLFHFREHFPVAQQKTRSQVCLECPDFRLIADVSNAAKHAAITRPTSEGDSLVASAEDIYEITILTEFEDDQGEYRDAQTVVMVDCTDGMKRNLGEALTNVLNYWGLSLKQLGYYDFKPRRAAEAPGSRFLRRDEVRGLNFEAMQRVRFKHSFQLTKFDHALGRAMPVDITGHQFKFTLYKPRTTTLEIRIKPDEGEEILVNITLTQDQAVNYELLKTDAEREHFLKKLAVGSEEVIALGKKLGIDPSLGKWLATVGDTVQSST